MGFIRPASQKCLPSHNPDLEMNHHTKFEHNLFINVCMHAGDDIFWTQLKAAISFIYLNLTLKYYLDIQIALLQHHTHFHLDHLKSVQETEANKFSVQLTLRHPAMILVTGHDIKWSRSKVPISLTGMRESG